MHIKSIVGNHATLTTQIINTMKKYTYIVSYGVNLSHLHDSTTCDSLARASGLAELNWSEGNAWQVSRVTGDINFGETEKLWNSKKQDDLDKARKSNIYRKSKGYALTDEKECRYSLFNHESKTDRKERLSS
tara:strand:+ start:440 stop:835 length:396 start_codon:yes stop_codon:yes gene_type:complete